MALLLSLLLASCLTSREDYQELYARATDWDLDGESPPKHGGADCDDDDDTIFPDAPELCDNKDNDCDGLVDEDVQRILYVDEDGDGFGDPARAQGACVEGLGLVASGEDCDDSDPAVNPDAEEICDNGVDDDCSGDASGCRWEGELDLGDASARWMGEDVDDFAIDFAVADLNGDGADDLFVGARYHDTENGEDSGALYGVYGPLEEGISSLRMADFKILGDQERSGVGNSLFFELQDVTLDGVDDLLLGDNLFNGRYYEPAVLVFEGPLDSEVDITSPSHTITHSSQDVYLNLALYSIGDVSGDGLTDIVFEASEELSNGDWRDTWFVLHTPIPRDTDLADAEGIFIVEEPGDEDILEAVAAGDHDGDGVGDVLLSMESTSAQQSAILLFPGPIESVLTTSEGAAVIRGPYQGNQEGWWGFFPENAGDTNGDGYEDIIVSAPFASVSVNNGGAAYLFLGPIAEQSTLGDAEATYVGELEYSYSGITRGPGDVDADGFTDLTLGHVEDVGGGERAYQHLVFFGPVSGVLNTASSDWLVTNDEDESGLSLASEPYNGDLNHDGTDDLIWPVSDLAGQGGIAIYFGSGI